MGTDPRIRQATVAQLIAYRPSVVEDLEAKRREQAQYQRPSYAAHIVTRPEKEMAAMIRMWEQQLADIDAEIARKSR